MGIALGGVSLCLWVIVVTIFWTGSDTMAFATSLPIWACCLIFSFPALIAWLVFGSRIGLLGIIVWVAYGIVITDFLPPIARTGMEYYKMPPSPDARQIRVLTLYEGCEEPPPIEQISKLRADVIFVQGCSNYNRTLKFAYSIFGRTSYIKQIGSCAIIVRHGQIGPAQTSKFRSTTSVWNLLNIASTCTPPPAGNISIHSASSTVNNFNTCLIP